MKRNNGGFSLVEIVVAMAILGAFSIAACTSLVLGLRLNDKSESMLQAQLAVSHAVETLMAEGIIVDEEGNLEVDAEGNLTITHRFPNVQVTAEQARDVENNPVPYYNVTVKSTAEDFTVTTHIRQTKVVTAE